LASTHPLAGANDCPAEVSEDDVNRSFSQANRMLAVAVDPKFDHFGRVDGRNPGT
jgi:hypothetical protein